MGPRHWLEDGAGYTRWKSPRVRQSAQDIVHYDPESGQREVLVPACGPDPWRAVEAAEDRGLRLVARREEAAHLHQHQARLAQNTRGDYWVFDRDKQRAAETRRRGRALDADVRHVLAGRPPRGLCVPRTTCSFRTSTICAITQLTTDGSKTIINGTSDWVYEEEFGLRNGFRWSPDGKHIAYWQFDTTGVREFTLINNTDALYPQDHLLRLPEGRVKPTPPAAWASSRPAAGRRAGSDPNADPRNHYIPRMEWSQDSKQVVFQQLNRLQNTNQVIRGDARTGSDPGALHRSRRRLGGSGRELALDREREDASFG